MNRSVPRVRTQLLLAMICLFISLLSGCSDGGSTTTPPVNNGDIPNLTRSSTGIDAINNATGRSACAVNAVSGSKPKWTVLIYMNAANNLQPDSLTNIAQMALVGSNANLNIVVQWKQSNCATCGSPSFNETRRYKIGAHSGADVQAIQAGDTTVLNGDLLAPPGAPYYNTVTKQVDMGDYRVLQDFVNWGTQTYPADNLAVLIWNHGAGWKPTRIAGGKKSPTFRALSEDDESNNEIKTEQIPLALAAARQPIDAFILDCSLMQMIEVAYEVRNSARVMVGSEESPPGAGYPYNLWMTPLKNGTLGDPCGLGSNIVDNFVTYYRNTSNFNNITQSVIDLSKMQTLANSLDAFGTQLRLYKSAEATALANARNNVQRYDYADNKDLVQYADLVLNTVTAAPVKTAATNLLNALRGSNGAIMFNGYGKFGQTGSYGQAIYIPAPQSFLSTYNDLALSKVGGAPNWARFLTEQTQ